MENINPCSELPCRDCFCVSICMNKHYMMLFEDCFNLRIYFEFNQFTAQLRDAKKLIGLYKYLKPTQWGVQRHVPSSYIVVYDKSYEPGGPEYEQVWELVNDKA